jgi:hypothetical protein
VIDLADIYSIVCVMDGKVWVRCRRGANK